MCENMDHHRKRLRWYVRAMARKMEANRRVVRAMRQAQVFHAVRMNQLVSRMLSVSTINCVTVFFCDSDIDVLHGSAVVVGLNCWRKVASIRSP